MTKVMGARPRPWGPGQGRGGVAKAVRGEKQGLGDVAKAVVAWPRPRSSGQGLVGRDQGREAVSKAVGCGQVRGGVAKTLGAWPRP